MKQEASLKITGLQSEPIPSEFDFSFDFSPSDLVLLVLGRILGQGRFYLQTLTSLFFLQKSEQLSVSEAPSSPQVSGVCVDCVHHFPTVLWGLCLC